MLHAAPLAVLAILAFAGNSLIARAALGSHLVDAPLFTIIRLVAGALTLAVICQLRGGAPMPTRRDLPSALMLLIYAAAFSFAYLHIGAATGALILFVCVQLSMTAIGIATGARPRKVDVAGLALALAGLAWLLAPGLTAPPMGAAALMAAAGAAWGGYTVRGRSGGDPVVASARNFIGAAVLSLPLIAWASMGELHASGVGLAVASGALTSALGYVVWYSVLPRLPIATAASAQLSVPLVTALIAAVSLGEALSMRLLVAGVLIFAGIGLTIGFRRKT